MKNILISIASIAVLAFAACETIALSKTATSKERATAALKDARTGLKFTVGPVITGWLIMEKDPAKQAEDAAWVYAAAKALDSAATGKIMTKEELTKIIVSFGGDDVDQRYIQLSQLLANQYAEVASLFKVSETNPAKFLAEISVLAQNAAYPFLAK